jgi:hypothetical protein
MPAALPKPSTLPDFAHWARMARWSLAEAAALSLDIDPDAIDSDDLAEPTRTAFAKRLALASNHAQTGRLAHHAEPATFLSWAASNGIPCSQRLCESVEQHGGAIADWRHQAEALTARCDAYQHRVTALEEQLCARADLPPSANEPSKKSAELGPNQARSVKKLILGMAMARYGYRPDGGRTRATKLIVDSLAQFGIAIDEQTVLDWLRRAADDIEHAIPN